MDHAEAGHRDGEAKNSRRDPDKVRRHFLPPKFDSAGKARLESGVKPIKLLGMGAQRHSEKWT